MQGPSKINKKRCTCDAEAPSRLLSHQLLLICHLTGSNHQNIPQGQSEMNLVAQTHDAMNLQSLMKHSQPRT